MTQHTTIPLSFAKLLRKIGVNVLSGNNCGGQGRIADGGIETGESIIFSYETVITHIANASSDRLANTQSDSGTYPFYCLVDMSTICLAQGNLTDVEAALAGMGIQKNIVRTQGWPRIQDSPAIDQIWNSLRRKASSATAKAGTS